MSVRSLRGDPFSVVVAAVVEEVVDGVLVVDDVAESGLNGRVLCVVEVEPL